MACQQAIADWLPLKLLNFYLAECLDDASVLFLSRWTSCAVSIATHSFLEKPIFLNAIYQITLVNLANLILSQHHTVHDNLYNTPILGVELQYLFVYQIPWIWLFFTFSVRFCVIRGLDLL